MKRSILIAAAFASLSSFAFADESKSSGSEFMHQANAGKWEVTPNLGYTSMTYKMNGDDAPLTELDETGMGYSVMGEYGINDMLSVGLTLSGENMTFKQKVTGATADNVTSNGMNDIMLFVHGRMENMGPGTFRFGANLAVSPGNATQDAKDNTNNYSGGIHFEPYVNYEMMFGVHTVGLKLAYNLLVSNDKTTVTASDGTTSTYTTKGGNRTTTSVYWEMPMAPVTLGAALNFINQVSRNSTDANGNPTASSGLNALNGWTLSLYVPWEIAPNITLLPMFQYGIPQASAIADTTSISGWNLNVGARFTF